MRETVGATVEEFPLADLRTSGVGASSTASVAPASANGSLFTAPSVTSNGVPVRLERLFFRYLCKAWATTEADVELQRASLSLPDGYRFPGPRGWDTRFVNLRDMLLDTQEDVQLDLRTRERLIFGLSPKWTMIKQILFPFLGSKFDISSLSMCICIFITLHIKILYFCTVHYE